MPDRRLGGVAANKQGREHLVEARGVRVVAACDVSPEVRAALQHDYPGFPCHSTLREMVAAERLDGVIVALPHHAVPAVRPEILAAGLHVLKEWPADGPSPRPTNSSGTPHSRASPLCPPSSGATIRPNPPR